MAIDLGLRLIDLLPTLKERHITATSSKYDS